MKKEEAIKKLSNTKVYVDGKSEQLQKKLFEIGFKWLGDGAHIYGIDKPFIFLSPDLIISCSYDMNVFTSMVYKEIKADDILSITIDKEYELKPFDKVLVRDYIT